MAAPREVLIEGDRGQVRKVHGCEAYLLLAWDELRALPMMELLGRVLFIYDHMFGEVAADVLYIAVRNSAVHRIRQTGHRRQTYFPIAPRNTRWYNASWERFLQGAAFNLKSEVYMPPTCAGPPKCH